MAISDLKRQVHLLKDYTELRLQHNRNLAIELVNGNLSSCEEKIQEGLFSRVYRRGAWGCASKDGSGGESACYVVEAASRNAEFLSQKQRLPEAELPRADNDLSRDLSTRKPRIGQGGIVDFLRAADSRLGRSCGYLKSRRFVFNEFETECSILTSDGASAYSRVPTTRVIAYLTAEKGGEKADAFHFYGGAGNFEDVFSDLDAFVLWLEGLGEHLAHKTGGVYPEGGLKECVLAPAVTGILAHEAIGHTAEADQVQAGSVAAHLLGKSVASPKITLVDFANTFRSGLCPVPVFTDEEGTPAADAELIKDGVLTGYLHSKETAALFGAKPHGNARAATYADEPLVRMRNTAILPGTDKLSDMLSSIDDGYYFMVPSNGLADLSSEFMFGIQIGYEVKKGRLGRPLKNTSVSGFAYDVLKSVSMVSDEFEWMSGARCGKRQWLTVGLGGAALKCLVNVGGK